MCWAASLADASPATLCPRQSLGMDVGKPQHTHTQSHRLLSWLSQLSPLFLQGRYAGSDGAYQLCMGRERLLGFKEQIRPSKRLSAPNAAYSPSKASTTWAQTPDCLQEPLRTHFLCSLLTTAGSWQAQHSLEEKSHPCFLLSACASAAPQPGALP